MFSGAKLSILGACNVWKKLVHCRNKTQSCLKKRHLKFSFFFFSLEQEVPMVYELLLKGGEKIFGNVYGNA